MTISTSLPYTDGRNSIEPADQPPANVPRIVGAGTAVTGESYSQQQLLNIFHITDPKVRSVFLNSAIQRRYLSLPAEGDGGARVEDALGVSSAWSAAHPGQLSVLLCAEARSAAYVLDSTMRTAVVNSLFGDGAVAVVLMTCGPRRSDISHWLVHSGGRKVIDAERVNRGLTRHDVRHTTGVLRDYGNLSSGSFLFSYERLLSEDIPRSGDYGVLMTTGPGSTIETALIQW
jgi:predicted naringenin-chalcone synthase